MLWKAKIKLANSRLEDVSLHAGNAMNAKLLFEQIYGKGSIVCGPMVPGPDWGRSLEGKKPE
jgi:hypothetical protein